MFTSYGIQEKYIPPEITSETGEAVLSIKDVYFWLNQYASYP